MKENRPFYINYHIALNRYRINTNNVDILEEAIQALSWYQWLKRRKLNRKLEIEKGDLNILWSEIRFIEKLMKSWEEITRKN